jgi:hypothetical protein
MPRSMNRWGCVCGCAVLLLQACKTQTARAFRDLVRRGWIQLIRNRTAPRTGVHSAAFDSTMQRANPALPWVRFWGPGLSDL